MMKDTNQKIMQGLLDLEIGSEIEELDLLAASCRLPTHTIRLDLEDEKDAEDFEGLGNLEG